MKRIAAVLLLVPSLAFGAPVTPRHVAKAGSRYYFLFRNNSSGVILEQEVSQAEFDALKVQGSSAPTRTNMTYVRALKRTDFGTPQVTLVDGDAVEFPAGVLVVLDGRKTLLPGTAISGGKIVPAGQFNGVTVDAQGRVERTGVSDAPVGMAVK